MFLLESDQDCSQTFKTNFLRKGKENKMEIDIGAAVNIVSEELFQTKFPYLPLTQAKDLHISTDASVRAIWSYC